MRKYEAQRICEQYSGIPKTRQEQEKLIGILYSTLRGKSLSQCTPNQIYTTAKRLYEQARIQVSVFREDADFIEQAREDNAVLLGQIFGIPADEIDTEALEARLLE